MFKSIIKSHKSEFETVIFNNPDNLHPLSFKIYDLEFKGSSFDDFFIEVNHLTKFALDNFTFNIIKYAYLCDCVIDCEIPLKLIESVENKEFECILKFLLNLGKPASNGGISHEYADFVLFFQNNNLNFFSDDLDKALSFFENEFKNFRFKNCHSCRFADFSPAGYGFFGDLYCFKNCTEEFKIADSKQQLLNLIYKSALKTQEIYICDSWKIK